MSDYTEHLISMAGGDGEPDLDGIQARADAATEGPWKAYDRGIGYEIHHAENWAINDRHRETFTKADAEFITAARTDVPALLAVVRSQQAKIERVKSVCDNWVLDPDFDQVVAVEAIRAALTATDGVA